MYHSPLSFTKSLLSLTDICTIHHIIPNTRKLTVVKTLFNRVNTRISDNKLKHREQLHIHSTLQLNGFPTWTTFLSPRKACSQDSPYKHFTSIPYVQGISEKIRRVLNEAGVNVAMRPVHTIRHVLPLPKDPYPKILAVLPTKSPV